MMNHMKWALSIAAGILAGSLSWAVAASAPDSYTKIEASSLLRTPQNAWARAILFSDTLVSPPGKRGRRLDRKTYFPVRLKEAGTVWVPEDLAPKFAALEEGTTYSFAGTVDQISRRYYVIVDACYTVQTTTDMTEHWIDMLHPEEPVMTPEEGLSETAMQSLLLSAQNSLIKLAEEQDVAVAQLIEAQSDGGQRIAEQIVADALRGELRAQGKTADELMIGAVLALLQKQAVLDESARIAQENAATESVADPQSASVPEFPDIPPAEVAAVEEADDAAPVEEAADIPAEPQPEAVEPETGVDLAHATERDRDDPIPEEESTKDEGGEPVASLPEEAESPVPEAALELETPTELMPDPLLPEGEGDMVQDDAPLVPDDMPVAEAAPIASLPEEEEPIPDVVPLPPQVDVPPLGEEEGGMVQETAPAAPPSSLLVGPLTDDPPEVVPMVSTEPTKAEIAQLQKEEKARLKEEKRLAAIEAKRRAAEEKKAARLAKIEAKRLAAEEKKAAAEARKAELAREKAEALRLREEEAARKAAEWKAQKEAARAEAEAKAFLAEQERVLALREKEALAAIQHAEFMAKQEEEARRMREETEKRMAELEARKAAAEAARIEAEAQREADLKRIQEDAAAKAAAKVAAQAARLAEEEARQAEALRIAEEVAEHERQVAEEIAARIAEEQAVRQAAEDRMAEMQRDIEQAEADAQRQAELQRIQAEAEAKAAAAAAEEAARLASEEAERDEQAAEARMAEMQRDIEQAEADARRQADEEPPVTLAQPELDPEPATPPLQPQDSADDGAVPVAPDDDQPEWMQPVFF